MEQTKPRREFEDWAKNWASGKDISPKEKLRIEKEFLDYLTNGKGDN